MHISREIHVEHPRPGVAVNVGVSYMGPALDRVEVHSYECEGRDDLPLEPKVRRSSDNGRTWSPFEPLPEIVTFEGDYTFLWGEPVSGFYDPATKMHVAFCLRQTIAAKQERRYYNHCFCCLSQDGGRTWRQPQHLRYEEGAQFDPKNPLDPAFLENNLMYPGNNTIRHSNGTLIHVGTHMNIPKDAPDPDPERKYGTWDIPAGVRAIGSRAFVGRWDPAACRYLWQPSNCAWLPRSVSCRGLMEAEVAELADGRVLVIWRGSDTPETPGRKWFTLSQDGGLTLSEVGELKYDDSSRFYSPSSYHRTIRHSLSGRLYWIGNICAQPPVANSPRHPLVMLEVEETIPALKRDTLCVIDDRQPDQSQDIQFSNFSLLENRVTHDLEMFMTPIGVKARHADSAEDFWEADCYKYTLTLE